MISLFPLSTDMHKLYTVRLVSPMVVIFGVPESTF